MRTSAGKTDSRKLSLTRTKQSKSFLALTSSLALNQEYSSLLSQLAKLTYAPPSSQTQRAYLFDLLNLLRDIERCHNREKSSYFRTADHTLRDFIRSRQLLNAGNLIGKYDYLKNQIEYCLQKIRLADEEEVLADEQSPDQQEQLAKELGKLVKRRIQLQNRQEMIEQQLAMAEKRAADERAQLLEEEMYGCIELGNYEAYSEQMIQDRVKYQQILMVNLLKALLMSRHY